MREPQEHYDLERKLADTRARTEAVKEALDAILRERVTRGTSGTVVAEMVWFQGHLKLARVKEESLLDDDFLRRAPGDG